MRWNTRGPRSVKCPLSWKTFLTKGQVGVLLGHSVVSDSAAPADGSMPGFPVLHLPELVMPSNHLIPCRPLLLLTSIFSSIRVFFKKSALHIRWPKYSSFSFSLSPANEHSDLISFRMDW